MRLGWLAPFFALVLTFACRRTAPEGSGPVELAPLGSAGSTAARPTHSVASFPGGAVLVGDATSCTMARIENEVGTRWQRSLPACDGRLAVAVAPDSTAFARTGSGLVAIGADGVEKWRLAVGNDPVPDALFAPGVTLDSLVVVSRARNAVVAFKADGNEAWRFQLADEEPLVAAPIGGAGEGTVITTAVAVYLVGSDGATRFRRTLPIPQP
jgi:outer membrane protein assembly factor BamB